MVCSESYIMFHLPMITRNEHTESLYLDSIVNRQTGVHTLPCTHTFQSTFISKNFDFWEEPKICIFVTFSRKRNQNSTEMLWKNKKFRPVSKLQYSWHSTRRRPRKCARSFQILNQLNSHWAVRWVRAVKPYLIFQFLRSDTRSWLTSYVIYRGMCYCMD